MRLGNTVRKLIIPFDDPLSEKLGELDREAKNGRAFYTYWHITRRYTAEDLRRAEAFQLIVVPRQEPVGEECGTIYDELIIELKRVLTFDTFAFCRR